MPDQPDGSWDLLRARVAWARAVRRAGARRHGELTDLVSQEIGKTRFECFASEIVPWLRGVRYAERRIGGVMRARRVGGGGLLSPGIAVRQARVPRGRVGIIATWNYPVGLLGVQAVQALIAGNRIVVKPSERSPRSQGLLLDLLREPAPGVTLPEGVLEVLEATREAGACLVARAGDPDPTRRIDHVVFTGSTEVGRQIAARVAESLTTSTLELSGRDTALVLGDADPVLAATTIWSAVRLNAGQTCMAPRRAIVSSAVYDRFMGQVERLAAGTPAVRLVNQVEADRARGALAEVGVARGGRVIAGAGGGAGGEDRRAMPITVVGGCGPEAGVARGAHFGPVLAVIRAADDAEALRVHRAFDQRLATSVFSRDVGRVRREIAVGLGSGIVTVNDAVVPTGDPSVSIGGLGASGWGVSRGVEGLREMTRPVWITTTRPRLRTPTKLLEGEAAERFMKVVGRMLGA